MVKFPEASARLYKNIFVCRKCKGKMRSTPQKINAKMLICRSCGSKSFRAVRKGK